MDWGGGDSFFTVPVLGFLIAVWIVSVTHARLLHAGIGWLTAINGGIAFLFIFGTPLDGPAAIQIFLQAPLVPVLLAACLLKGNPERQLAKFGKRIDRWQNYPFWQAVAYIGRGNFLAHLGRKDEAMADYDRALQLKPALRAALNAKRYWQNH